MKKFKLTKVIATSLIAVSVLALNPAGASAEWRKDSNGWWYANGNSWYTGWQYINGKTYYFYDNGYMASNTTIDNHRLGSDGAFISSENTQSASAQNIVYEQESNSSIGSATSIPQRNESYLVGTITKNTDLDYYKFTIDSTKKVTLMGSLDNDSLGLTKDMNIGILNSNETIVGATSPIELDGETSQLLAKYELPAGTYYIVVVPSQEYNYLWDNNKYGILVQFE